MSNTQITSATRRTVGVPPLLFTFTIDQIASMLAVTEHYVMTNFLFFVGRTPGRKQTLQMSAVNIAPPDEKPIWRVQHAEFLQWCKRRGFRISQAGIHG